MEKNLQERLKTLDWNSIQQQLHNQGFAVVSNILLDEECEKLKENYALEEVQAYRKTIKMERYRFGLGEYKYYKYPLPELIEELRKVVYPYLVPVANQWMQELKIDTRFPKTHEEMLAQCHKKQQVNPTALILKYGKGGFNTLHQDLYGEVYFPMQIVFMLNQVGKDYEGGEFVITEQIPRAQSKVNVLQPNKGDMIIFTTKFRPYKGTKGYYRVNMKHGVSTVHSGNRYTMGIIFHDALT